MADLIDKGSAAAPVPDTMEGLRSQNRAYRTLCASLEAQMAILTEKGREYQEAVSTLDSERQANAILTDEITALRARVAELEEALRDIAHGRYDGMEVEHYTAHECREIARALLAQQGTGHG